MYERKIHNEANEHRINRISKERRTSLYPKLHYHPTYHQPHQYCRNSRDPTQKNKGVFMVFVKLKQRKCRR